MSDFVQVPREAIEILLDHYLHCYGGIHDQLALDVRAVLTAAPQATAPRDEKIESLNEQNKRLWKDCANLGLAATLNSDRADAAEATIATLTAERDALREAVEAAKAEYQNAIFDPGWVALRMECFLSDCLTNLANYNPQPSKTETRDDG